MHCTALHLGLESRGGIDETTKALTLLKYCSILYRTVREDGLQLVLRPPLSPRLWRNKTSVRRGQKHCTIASDRLHIITLKSALAGEEGDHATKVLWLVRKVTMPPPGKVSLPQLSPLNVLAQ